jgi:deoxyribodipyrimidine photo-lyase
MPPWWKCVTPDSCTITCACTGAKKILEWSSSPEAAFDTAIRLNNRYFLDGRDPNSFAGVGWVFGLHDRAWFEREIFGKVRFLAASGLERKCDIHAYVENTKRRLHPGQTYG